MAWSTSELANLAGTTVNAIRHYHRLGLLDEPERRTNGYKEYGVLDLIRLLRIRRLTELGVPLSQIDDVSGGVDGAPEVLRLVDVDHAAAIERLEKARQDIAAILSGDAPPGVPPGFENVASRLSDADYSILHLYHQIYDGDAMGDLRRMVEAQDPARDDLDSLAPDADEATRQRLAETYAPILAQHLRDYPWLNDPLAHTSKQRSVTPTTVVEAVNKLYNATQLDVLRRACLLAREQLSVGSEPR